MMILLCAVLVGLGLLAGMQWDAEFTQQQRDIGCGTLVLVGVFIILAIMMMGVTL